MPTDLQIRKLKPSERHRWIGNGDGLHLRVAATGGRSLGLLRRRKKAGGSRCAYAGPHGFYLTL
jgi:hypothetical protein